MVFIITLECTLGLLSGCKSEMDGIHIVSNGWKDVANGDFWDEWYNIDTTFQRYDSLKERVLIAKNWIHKIWLLIIIQ